MDPELKALIDKNLGKVVDYSEEAGPCSRFLQDIAKRDKCALMAFVAPYAAVRVSPTEVREASIGLSEEFGVVGAVDKLKATWRLGGTPERLYLLINSPGGLVHSSYKIAKLLRTSFKYIKVFIPHVAASGGTLIALSGNEVVMGTMSHLTPIDVQVPYAEQYVSAYCMARALSRLSGFFSKTTEDEAPYPWRCMTEKLDPILMEHWSSTLTEISTYANELLTLSGYDQDSIDAIVEALVFPTRPHSFVLDRDRAARLKIRLSASRQDGEDLKVMEAWLTEYMLKAADKHVIRFVTPNGKKNTSGKKNTGGANESRKKAPAKNQKGSTAKS